MRPVAFIIFLVGASACGRGHYATFSYAQVDGGCPGTPGALVNGPQPNGAGCDADADCMIVCCSCANRDGRGFAAHACLDGKCSSDQACALPSARPDVCP
jgi:hypothetical protein